MDRVGHLCCSVSSKNGILRSLRVECSAPKVTGKSNYRGVCTVRLGAAHVVRCSTKGSSNGRPRRDENRPAAESLNGSISPSTDRASLRSVPIEAKRPSKVQTSSGWLVSEGEDPFRLMQDGRKVYLDELDVITLLDPPKFLRPFQSMGYNHAAFLWKKIGDIPEDRRHRLLDLLLPSRVAKMWDITKLRYEDPELFVDDADSLISKPAFENPGKVIVWDGQFYEVPWYFTPFSRFQKVFFSKNGKVYGRVKAGGFLLEGVQGRLAPLYFRVLGADHVMATDDHCDLKFDFGDGQLHLRGNLPPGFPHPVRHVSPFNDKTCYYLRAVGPGVVVGQTWVEGEDLEQIPRRFGNFVMVQKYN